MKKSLFLVLIIFSSFLLSQQSLKSNLESIIKDKNATIGVSVWNLEKGEKTSVNGDSNLPMMSVFKLHIAMTILDLVDGGTLKLDQKIKFSKSELMQNTWSPMRDKYPNGGDIPLSEMIKYVVAQSDNNTCDILLNKIGGLKTVENYIHKIGVTDFWAVANEKMMHKVDGAIYKNLTTANASNLLLTKLYT
ncbi:serine hydrolase [Chryseobacterium sp. NEB161]|nr:serine hydrolase [Chryseobacterium sp. NEB161]